MELVYISDSKSDAKKHAGSNPAVGILVGTPVKIKSTNDGILPSGKASDFDSDKSFNSPVGSNPTIPVKIIIIHNI